MIQTIRVRNWLRWIVLFAALCIVARLFWLGLLTAIPDALNNPGSYFYYRIAEVSHCLFGMNVSHPWFAFVDDVYCTYIGFGTLLWHLALLFLYPFSLAYVVWALYKGMTRLLRYRIAIVRINK